MTPRTLSGLVALALAAPVAAQPRPDVVEQPDANGWTVRVAFKSDPGATARVGHTWTRGRAVRLAERVAQEFPEDAIAGVRVEGKDGDGKIDPVRGPHPTLPDWPLLAEKFRTRTRAPMSDLQRFAQEAREKYEQAQKETEDLARPRTPIPTEKEKALQQLYKTYNDKLDELSKALKGEPAYLPRLTPFEPPYLYEHVQKWDEAKKDQYQAETLATDLDGREVDLSRQRKDITLLKEMIERETDPATLTQLRQSLKDAESRYERTEQELKDDRKAVDELNKAADNRLGALENRLADPARVPPPADAFAGTGATFAGDDTPKVYKTDRDGNPLPDDRQPSGYPKPLDPGDKLAADEKAVVNPSLRVKPLDPKADVQAGVYGKVVEVDKDKGAMTVQVGESGLQVQYLGVNPEGVKPGNYIEPYMSLGTVRERQLVIRAVNSRKQLVPPGPVLNYARQRPVEGGSLRRPAPEADPPPADGSGKARLPEGDGKYDPNYKVVLDDSVGKGGVRKWFEYDETARKEKGLDAKEVMAQRELERQKAEAERQKEAAGQVKSRIKDAERDLETARNKVEGINKESRQLVKRAQDLADRKKELDDEERTLKAAKARIDQKKATARTKAQVAAVNDEVKEHNAKVDRWEEKNRKLEAQKKELQTEIAAAQRDRKKAEADETRARQEKEKLQGELRTAEARAKTAADAIGKKQSEVQSLAAERQKLKDQLKALESKKDAETKQ